MNKKLAIFTLLSCLILGIIAAYGWHLREQKPVPFYIEVPLSKMLTSDTERIQLKDEYLKIAQSNDVIIPAVREAKLAELWQINETEAAEQLRQRTYISIRNGEKSAIMQFGVSGIRRDVNITKPACNALWASFYKKISQP